MLWKLQCIPAIAINWRIFWNLVMQSVEVGVLLLSHILQMQKLMELKKIAKNMIILVKKILHIC